MFFSKLKQFLYVQSPSNHINHFVTVVRDLSVPCILYTDYLVEKPLQRYIFGPKGRKPKMVTFPILKVLHVTGLFQNVYKPLMGYIFHSINYPKLKFLEIVDFDDDSFTSFSKNTFVCLLLSTFCLLWISRFSRF